jgi:3-dehydroquinate synthetase
MVFAARLSEAMSIAQPGLANRTQRLLKSLGLDGAGALAPPEQVLEAMRLDKKYRTGLRFVVLEDVGRPRIVEDVSEERIRDVLESMGGGT